MDVILKKNSIHTATKDWVWPAKDEVAWEWVCREPNLPQEILNVVPKTKPRGALIAGAHTGFYAKQYAQHCGIVYAIEPEPTNFYCLVQNVEDYNVIKLQLALSNEVFSSKIGTIHENNSGACNLGEIGHFCATTTIDNVVSSPIDIIHLDVEGMELSVIIGAKKTIERYRPFLLLETLYPFPWQRTEDYLLECLDYKVHTRLPHDTIYEPK